MITILIQYYDSLDPILDAKRRKEVIDAYNAWVIYEPSIIDGDVRVARPHHVRLINNRCGTGIKPNDLWQVPITYAQHQVEYKYRKIFEEKLPELHERFINETKLHHLRVWIAMQRNAERSQKFDPRESGI